MSDRAEALLLAFARHRSERDFRALYDLVTPAMLGLAMRLAGGDRATAEDVVQEAWSRAVDRVDRYAAPASVTRWLNGFVVRCWSEQRRAALREPPMDDESLDALGSGDPTPAWSEWPLLRQALYDLPEGYRAVVVLHDVEGHTHEEIAERLGIEAGTSKSQLARGRARLRAALAGRSREGARR